MLRALVVDDEPRLRQVVVRVCADLGLQIAEAGDGLEACEILERGPLDLIVLDLAMPRLDGFGVLRRFKERPVPGRTGVVVLTAATDPREKVEATRLGALDFVNKPFRLEDLRRRLERCLKIVDLERRLDESQAQLDSLRQNDGDSGAETTAQLFHAVEDEFNKAKGNGAPLGCLVISDEGYDETLRRAGRGPATGRLHALVRGVEERIGPDDRVFRVDAAELVALLPGADRKIAASIAQSIVDARIPGTVPGDLAVALAVYPHPEIAQASVLYRAANVALARARSRGAVCFFEGF